MDGLSVSEQFFQISPVQCFVEQAFEDHGTMHAVMAIWCDVLSIAYQHSFSARSLKMQPKLALWPFGAQIYSFSELLGNHIPTKPKIV